MLEKEDAVIKLMRKYALPLEDAVAGALQFHTASADVTWHSLYQHCKANKGQAPSQVGDAQNAEPRTADGDAVARCHAIGAKVARYSEKIPISTTCLCSLAPWATWCC